MNTVKAISQLSNESNSIHTTTNQLRHEKALIDAQIHLDEVKQVVISNKIQTLQIKLQHEIVAAEDDRILKNAAQSMVEYIDEDEANTYIDKSTEEFNTLLSQLKDAIAVM